MMSPAAHLLQHLLTHSDLERLGGGAEQADAWMQAGGVTPIGTIETGAGVEEAVYVVIDEKLVAEFAGRLAAEGQAEKKLSAPQVEAYLRECASVADETGNRAGSDVVRRLAIAVANLDDEAVFAALAAPAPTSRGPGGRPRTAMATEWFDIDELEAAMGDLLPMTEADAGGETAGGFEMAPASAPDANLTEDLYALADMVHQHTEQLAAVADLPETVAALTQRVHGLQEALAELGVAPAPPGDGLASDDTGAGAPDLRRKTALAIGCALSGWSVLMWFGTGSATLAISSLVAAAVVVGLACKAPHTAR